MSLGKVTSTSYVSGSTGLKRAIPSLSVFLLELVFPLIRTGAFSIGLRFSLRSKTTSSPVSFRGHFSLAQPASFFPKFFFILASALESQLIQHTPSDVRNQFRRPASILQSRIEQIHFFMLIEFWLFKNGQHPLIAFLLCKIPPHPYN